jgi:isoquinoline 1-oxidoreductase alpha subunit
MTAFRINGRAVTVDVDEDTPLLWVIRDVVGLTGTKFGCGIGMCGACTVHVGGRPTRSCITPVGYVADSDVTTIDGLDPAGQHPLHDLCPYPKGHQAGCSRATDGGQQWLGMKS